jgi:glycosyltransferase involved in cell wall biosynthesis
MQPLVSVIIPNYNSGNYLHEALMSVFSQDYKSLEVIVVDDGSTDDSLSKITEFSEQILLLKSENFGAASARNIGILASKGQLIAFLDSDDLWVASKLSTQVEILEENDLDLVYCSGQEFQDESGLGSLQKAKYKGDCYQYFRKYPSRDIFAIGPSGVLLKKSLLKLSGIFDTAIPAPTEDWDFFRRYSQYAKVGFSEKVLVLRRIHKDNISRRSLVGYYNGNRNAILKMFIDDAQIGLKERRIIWAKFHWISSKSFLSNHDVLNGIRAVVRIFLPVLS